MTREIEAVVYCKTCQVDKFTVYRVQADNEGVYTNECEPAAQKLCDVCGTVLERKQ